MTEEKKIKSTDIKPEPIDPSKDVPSEDIGPAQQQQQLRHIVIVTDGINFKLDEKHTQCSPLEIKEICRGLLKQLGG